MPLLCFSLTFSRTLLESIIILVKVTFTCYRNHLCVCSAFRFDLLWLQFTTVASDYYAAYIKSWWLTSRSDLLTECWLILSLCVAYFSSFSQTVKTSLLWILVNWHSLPVITNLSFYIHFSLLLLNPVCSKTSTIVQPEGTNHMLT